MGTHISSPSRLPMAPPPHPPPSLSIHSTSFYDGVTGYCDDCHFLNLALMIFYDVISDRHEVQNQFPCNKDLGFITYQPFPPQKRTSTRPWCRPVFTQLQRRELEKRFQASNYVGKRERYHFGAMLGLSETQVKVWFQNRRTKCRHEAAKKKEKQNREQALKKANSRNQRQELKSKNDKKEGNKETCMLMSK